MKHWFLIFSLLFACNLTDDDAFLRDDDMDKSDLGNENNTTLDSSKTFKDANNKLQTQLDISLLFPFAYLSLYSNKIIVRGSAENAISVSVNGVEATSDDDFHNWSVKINLDQQDTLLHALAVGKDGSQVMAEGKIRRDSALTSTQEIFFKDDQKGIAIMRDANQIIEFDLEGPDRKVLLDYKVPQSNYPASAWDQDTQTLFVAHDNALDIINLKTGEIRPNPMAGEIQCMVFRKKTLYLIKNNALHIFSENQNKSIPLSEFVSGDCQALFFDDDEKRIIAIIKSSQNTQHHQYTIYPKSEKKKIIDSFPELGKGVKWFTWDGDRNQLYYSNNIGLFSYNKVSKKWESVNGLMPGPWVFNSTHDVFFRIRRGILSSLVKPQRITHLSPRSFPEESINLLGLRAVIPVGDQIWIGASSFYRVEYDHSAKRKKDAHIIAFDRVGEQIYTLSSKSITKENIKSGESTFIHAIPFAPYGSSFQVDEENQRYFYTRLNRIVMVGKPGDEAEFNVRISSRKSGALLLWREGRLLYLSENIIRSLDLDDKAPIEYSHPNFGELLAIGKYGKEIILLWTQEKLLFFNPETNEIKKEIVLLKSTGFQGEMHSDFKNQRIWLDNAMVIDVPTGQMAHFVR